MPALLASAALARSAAPARAAIVCPEGAVSPGCCGPVAQPLAASQCCPVATAGCCAPIAATDCCTTSACTQQLSIGVTPDPAIDGQSATIRGTLTGGTVAAQPVILWQRLAGQSGFSDVAQTQTDAAGAFQFVQPVQIDARWYAKSGNVVSSTVHEPVRAAIVLRASRVGANLTLLGSIAPSHAHERVSLEQLRGRRWATIARPKLGAHSSFAVRRSLLGHSVERFRVVVAADAHNSRSVSLVLVIPVS